MRMILKQYSKSQTAVIMLLLIFMAAQILAGMLHNSVTWDELFFIGEGKAIFSTGYMRYIILADHPPLSYYLNSIFLIPLKFDNKLWDPQESFKIGNDVLFHSQYNYKLILFLSRLPFVVLSIIGALYLLKWATEIYGSKSGLAALFFYSFNPSIIAYAGVATSDFTTAIMIFIAAYYFWKLLKEQSAKHLALSGIFFGLAQLSKITSIILIPSFIIIGLTAVYSKKYKLSLKNFIKNLLIIFLIAFIVMWAFHKFQFGTLNNSMPAGYYNERAKELLSKSQILSKQLLFVYEKVPMPMPIYFGMAGNTLHLSAQEKDNYVFGEITNRTAWYMGLLTFFLKTHLSLMLALALVFVFSKKLPKADMLTNISLTIPIILIFVLFSINNKLSGIRHMLAIYPFIFILAGNVVNIKLKKKSLLLFIVFLPYLISAFLTAPYYMSYMNILAGGPSNAYKIMVGANIDQGQDLLELKEFVQENKIVKIKLSYWGSVNPKDYGIDYEYIPSPQFQPWQNGYAVVLKSKNINEDCSERKGWIAISVTNLQNVHLENKKCYDWLKKYEPIKRIGYSIFIYNLK